MRIGLFVPCYVDAFEPEVGIATLELLERFGLEVEYPYDQTCCGQPMVNSGYLDEAVPAVRAFASAFEGYDAVVVPSGSCAGCARHQHDIVARRAGDPVLSDAVSVLGPRTYELSEFLVDVLGVVGNKYEPMQNEASCDLLDALTAQPPTLGRRIRDETGRVRRFVNVYVDGEDVRWQDGLATAVPDGAVVQVLPSVAGG